MSDFPQTRPSLLLRVQHDEADAWSEFSRIYRPMIYRLVRRRGWQDSDAHDVTQKVMVKLSSSISTFQPNASSARFSTWLITICKRTMIDELRGRKKVDNLADSSEFNRKAIELSQDDISIEHRRQVFRWAADKARDHFAKKTWLAFWKTAVDGKSVAETACELELTAGSVYTARSRVMAFLKSKVQEYDDAEV